MMPLKKDFDVLTVYVKHLSLGNLGNVATYLLRIVSHMKIY